MVVALAGALAPSLFGERAVNLIACGLPAASFALTLVAFSTLLFTNTPLIEAAITGRWTRGSRRTSSGVPQATTRPRSRAR